MHFVHSFIPLRIHLFIRSFLFGYICLLVHSSSDAFCSFVHSSSNSSVHSFIPLRIHLFIHSFLFGCICSFVHTSSFVHSSSDSFVRSSPRKKDEDVS